jgi:hypothetical protein
MVKSGKFFIIGAALLFVFGIMIAGQGTANAQEAVLIKISSVGAEKITGISINPQVATIKKDTIVVWLNGVQDQEIKVEFADGKKCKSVTAFPVNFDLDTARWCYVTSYVPFAATSSLQFVDAGTYEYTVLTKDGAIKASGKIVVKNK